MYMCKHRTLRIIDHHKRITDHQSVSVFSGMITVAGLCALTELVSLWTDALVAAWRVPTLAVVTQQAVDGTLVDVWTRHRYNNNNDNSVS